MTDDPLDQPPRSMLDQHRFVEMRLAEFGLRIPTGSRLDRESRIFRAAAGTTRTIFKGDPLYVEALAAKLDMQIFEFILESDGMFDDSPIAVRKLKIALRDAVDPGSSDKTTGRDAQAELYIAAAIHNSGVPISFEKPESSKRPDLRLMLPSGEFFVEAKRPKSTDRLIERVKEGVKQVNETRSSGALFVDVGLALNPDRQVVEAKETDEVFRSRYGIWLNARIKEYESQLFDALRGSHTTGIMFSDHQIRRVTETASTVESLSIMFPNPSSSREGTSKWQEFITHTNRGWWPWNYWSRKHGDRRSLTQ